MDTRARREVTSGHYLAWQGFWDAADSDVTVQVWETDPVFVFFRELNGEWSDGKIMSMPFG